MKQLVVLSGKGGTGQTSVAAALADLASRGRRVVLVDADADAANLALLFPVREQSERPFFGADVATIDGGSAASGQEGQQIVLGKCRLIPVHGNVGHAAESGGDPVDGPSLIDGLLNQRSG